MKKTKKLFFPFQPNECDAAKEYFEEMASKGWKLKSINTFLTFEKAEPQNLKYSVEVFDKASNYDTRPGEEARAYIEYCRQTGWEYVCCSGKIFVFVTTDENIIPIEPCETLKLKAIKNSIIKQQSWLLITPILLLFNNLISFYNFEYYITSNLSLLMAAMTIVLILFLIAKWTGYFIWYRKAKHRLSAGQSLNYITKEDLKRKVNFRKAPIVIFLLSLMWFLGSSLLNENYFSAIVYLEVIGLIIFIFIFSYFFQKKGFSRATNIIVPFLVGFGFAMFFIISTAFVTDFSPNKIKTYESAPLSIRDFGIYTDQQSDADQYFSSSILASNTSCYNSTDKNREGKSYYISYDIFKSNYSFIINQYVKSKTNRRYASGYKKVSGYDWGAEYVYVPAEGYGDKIVVYKDLVFSYNTDEPLTKQNIDNIKQKLNLFK